MNTTAVLAFDIQGTTVDFYGPLMRMGAAIDAEKRLSIDWSALSVAWRGLYRETMDAVIDGRRPWIRVDQIYRAALDRLLDDNGLSAAFTSTERDAINRIWTRLDPWPDSVAGLERLRRRYTLTTLSNAGMAAVVAVVKHAALPFDAVLTAELARSYKPAPAVYQLAVDYVGAPASSIMMVACHKYDLLAAKAFGMRTAFVARPLEFGPDGEADCTPDEAFDVNARDFLDLADQLGA
jgi:2-haloacid dehalogenase